MRQQHGGGGEPVTAGVRALPHLARPCRRCLEGDGPAADGAARRRAGRSCTPAGPVRAREPAPAAPPAPRRGRRDASASNGRPSRSRGVGDVTGEQPGRPVRPPATRTRREVGWWASACWPGRRISSSRPPASWQAAARAAPSVGVEVGLGQGVAAPGPALLHRQPEPCLGRAAERADARLLGQHRAGVGPAVRVGDRAGRVGRSSRRPGGARSLLRGGHSGSTTVPGSAPATAAIGVEAGVPEPSRLPVAAGSSTGDAVGGGRARRARHRPRPGRGCPRRAGTGAPGRRRWPGPWRGTRSTG